MRSDGRPWRTLTEKLPEETAVKLERAIWLAKSLGMANNRIEGFEALAAEFEVTYLAQALAAMEKWQTSTLECYDDAGWRCLKCGTSKKLSPHHGIPKSHGGPDDRENKFCLCIECHNLVQPRWKHWLERLRFLRARSMAQVEKQGWRVRDLAGGLWREP